MYSKEEMILWSLISSLLVKSEELEVFKFSPKLLFDVFQRSLKLKINIFKCAFDEKILILNEIKEGKDLENLRFFFSDTEHLEILKNQVKREIEIIESKKIKILTYFCEKYIERLKRGSIPPFVIYYMGKLPKEKELKNSLGIIGRRFPNNLTLEKFCEEVAEYLKEKKSYNISGLALGCDTIGHKVTLKFKIKNICVLGQGLGTEIYPKENKELFKSILENSGLILSEIPPSIGVKGMYLLNRNRIQAYFSDGICLLESGKKGGSLTTIKEGIKEKKKIYVYNIEENRNIFTREQLKKIKFIDKKSDLIDLKLFF